MLRKIGNGCVVLALAAVGFAPIPVSATTLQQALAQAYQTSPSLLAARAALRAQDESVAQARAGLRPSASLSATAKSQFDLDNIEDSPADSFRASLDANLMLFDGGRTRDGINAAESSVLAARANLAATEQGVLLQTATAYLDVRRDHQFLSLAVGNLRLVEQQVQATQDRFAVGAVTRIDVSLAEARLAAAKTSLAANSGGLALSKEIYRAVVGNLPTGLSAPPALPHLPGSLAEAESIAMREHPSIIAARYMEKAAGYELARARAGRAPTLGLGANITYLDAPGGFFGQQQQSTSGSISLNGTLPIYQGGALSSAMRAAAQNFASRSANTQNMMRSVRQATASSWANIRVSEASIHAARLQIKANEIVYAGMQEETRLGARTMLDLLDAEQALLTSKSNLVKAHRDKYVAGLNLLSSMGLLTVENLKLGIPAYDPEINFNRVKNAPLSTFSGGNVLDAISDRWE